MNLLCKIIFSFIKFVMPKEIERKEIHVFNYNYWDM